MDEGDVLQADEAQHAPEVGLVKIHALAGTTAVDAAAARHHEDPLVLEQADGPLGPVAEGAARPDDMVDPGLEGRGDGKIVHRHGEENDVGRLDFLDETIGKRRRFTLFRRALLRGGQGSAQDRAGEVGDGLGHEIALDDTRAGMVALPGLDEVETQRPGLGILAQDARGDEEKLAHDSCSESIGGAPAPLPVQRWGFLSINRIDKI